jgi:N utilization substance protein B
MKILKKRKRKKENMNKERFMKKKIIREIVLETLFQLNFSDKTYVEIVETFEEITNRKVELSFDEKNEIIEYLEYIQKNKKKLDDNIKKHLKNWDFNRIGNVEKTVLRVAFFELINKKEIPMKVVINEAIELCKKYSEEDSGKFVNGVLSSFCKEVIEEEGV